jgi:DNA (cytosine-5)-methyltransferase 1
MTKYVSLFTGGGGLDLGLESVGFECLLTAEIDDHSCITLKNAKVESAKRGKPFLRDTIIEQMDLSQDCSEVILEKIGLTRGELPLLAGGPPCQAFSVFGKRKGLEDDRGQLSHRYVDLVANLAPEVFIFENVAGLLTLDNGDVFEGLKKKLSTPADDLNYTLSVHRINAVNYGVPQYRDRVFIIGCRLGRQVESIPATHTEKPEDNFNLLLNMTVRDALQGLPLDCENQVANHIGRKHSQRIIDRYGALNPGQRDHKTRINKLNLDKPSFTIIVGSDKGGGKGHIHPIRPREVTPRESARIQTFPDWWAFSGTSRHPIRQVGNAVPPILGAAVGNAIRTQIFGETAHTFEYIANILDQQHLIPELHLNQVVNG